MDSDFPDVDKWMVHEYLKEKYGEDKVTAVGVITYFGIKLALKEVCRYYKIPVPDANRMTSIVGGLEEVAKESGSTWRKEIQTLQEGDREFLENYQKAYPDLFDKAERMVGLPRQEGKHAAGYVISPEPLARLLPVRKSSNDEVISQFDKVAVERMGFLKADVLGLRNLTTLTIAARYVKEHKGIDIDFYRLFDDPNDIEVWEQFDKGRTLGIFQFDGAGITGVAKELKPRSVSDLSTIVALYRPGVIGAGMLDEYISRAKGEKPVEYVTPLLESVIGDTYGIIVYQEEAMAIFSELADFTDEEADHIRAAIGKKKLEKIQAEKPKFLAGCAKNGVTQEEAEEIFRQIEASGSYSFNKSHSYAYATIAFWTAYMKAHYPLEYYAASMSTVGSEKAPLYMQEARRRGIKIVPPILSNLGGDYTLVSDNEIAFGLTNVRGIGPKAIENILEAAPYEGFEDFVNRSKANSGVVKSMILCGAFREIYPNTRDLVMRYETDDYHTNLFGESLSSENRFACDYERAPFPDERIAEIETELFGMPLTIDPFDKYREMLGPVYDPTQSKEKMDEAAFDTGHVFLVKVQGVRLHMAKNGMMAFVTMVTDKEETIEAVCFSDMFKASQTFLREGRFLRVEILKRQYNGKVSLQINKIQNLEV